jgi:hypothetical protein
MDQVSAVAGLVAIESTDGDPTSKRKDVTRKRKKLEQGGEVSEYEPSPDCSGARPELNRKRHVTLFQHSKQKHVVFLHVVFLALTFAWTGMCSMAVASCEIARNGQRTILLRE